MPGPRMFAAHWHVSNNPGCAILPVARAIGPNGSTRFGYQAVHRAIRAGLIKATRSPCGSRYVLHAN